MEGYTSNYIRVCAPSDTGVKGMIVDTQLLQVKQGCVIGEIKDVVGSTFINKSLDDIKNI